VGGFSLAGWRVEGEIVPRGTILRFAREFGGLKLFHVEQFGGIAGEMGFTGWVLCEGWLDFVRGERVFRRLYPLLKCLNGCFRVLIVPRGTI
jgi:hypothetical protein